MPLMQDDIRRHYETAWKPGDEADLESKLHYGDPVANEIGGEVHERMLRDLKVGVDGGRVLDVGCGAGRWSRLLLERFRPREVVAIDYTAASVELLERWRASHREVPLTVRQLDFTEPGLDPATLGGPFDLVNVANVLFHIPEPEKYAAALANVAGLLAEGGRAITTEYLPRVRMRTNWMQVYSRYEFEALCERAGLRIVDVRPNAFFSNDPLGLDGPNEAGRSHFHNVRAGFGQLIKSCTNDEARKQMTRFVAEVERATLAFCRERCSPMDLPSQKFVALARR